MNRASDVLVDTLIHHGVDRVFCVPGESYLAVLDALVGKSYVDVVTCRHEGGAGFMAIADARATGRAGVALVSRGPGAMNASIALHSAQQDAVPFVLFVGQVERSHLGMSAFQEVDYTSVFGSIAKWVVEVRDADRLAESVARAFHAALSGTPGPVVVSLPEDMLEDLTASGPARPLALAQGGASNEQLTQVHQQLMTAQRPLVIAGGLLKGDEGQAALITFAEAYGVPVEASVRHADLLPNDHPLYAGHLAYGAPKVLTQALEQADFVLAVGTRLGDVTTQGYRFPGAPVTQQPVVQVWPDAAVVGNVRGLAMGLTADPVAFLRDMTKLAGHQQSKEKQAWAEQLHGLQSDLQCWKGPLDADDGVIFGAMVQQADQLLPSDAVITIDAGNFGGWVQRIMRFGGGRKMIAPSSGAMGYGVPAAVAMSLRYPGRNVVCFVGDGGFLMTGNELATAIQKGARPIIIVSDNSAYGTIRMHQEKHFPHRESATALVNPNFAGLAREFGALGITVRHSSEIKAALEQALAADGPVLISVCTSLMQISVGASINQLREGA